MSEPNNHLIYQELLKQSEQLGRIEANQLTDRETHKTHVKKDEEYYKRTERLEATHNRVRGAAAVWSFVVSGVVTVIGWYLRKSS